MKGFPKSALHYLHKLEDNLWVASSFIAILVTVFTIGVLNNLSLIQLSENHLLDVRVALLSPPRPQSQNIAVILIDKPSLIGLPYRSPLDRSLITRLLDQLENRSIVAIGINVLFDRPTESDKDEQLYRRLRSLRIPVVLSRVSNESGFSSEQIRFSRYFLEDMPTGLSLIYRDSIDNTVRTSLLKLVQGRTIKLGFAATLAEVAGIELPRAERINIDFRQGPDPSTPAFPTYSATQIASLPEDAFNNRIVLIGSDLGDSSRLRTPLSVLSKGFSRDLPGVVIEAHVLSQLIENRQLEISSSQEKTLITLLMALVGGLLAMARISLIGKLLLALVILPLAWLAALLFFYFETFLIPMVVPSLAFAIAVVFGAFWQWRSEFRRREQIHHAFGQFLAPTVVEQILLDPEELELKGELREISFLFTDLEGFTRLTEMTEPQIMVGLVNSYLEEACDIVIEQGGTIDKIVGDALHIMFNAPLRQSDHAQRAVECALALGEWSEGFRQRQLEAGIDLGVTRIGVNTGECIVGNFGGKRRFDYTAHGDAINTAARLEAINQRLGTTICVSETTVAQCQGICFRPVAILILRGKTQKLQTFMPVAALQVDEHLINQYTRAYEALVEESPLASTLFEQLAGQYPEDALVKLHWQRLQAGEQGATLIIRKK